MTIKSHCKVCDKATPHLHIVHSKCVCTICGANKKIKGTAKKDRL